VRLACLTAESAGNGPLLFPFTRSDPIIFLLAKGGDRLRQEPLTWSRCMPGYSMQLVKKRRETTIANNNELALAA